MRRTDDRDVERRRIVTLAPDKRIVRPLPVVRQRPFDDHRLVDALRPADERRRDRRIHAVRRRLVEDVDRDRRTARIALVVAHVVGKSGRSADDRRREAADRHHEVETVAGIGKARVEAVAGRVMPPERMRPCEAHRPALVGVSENVVAARPKSRVADDRIAAAEAELVAAEPGVAVETDTPELVRPEVPVRIPVRGVGENHLALGADRQAGRLERHAVEREASLRSVEVERGRHSQHRLVGGEFPTLLEGDIHSLGIEIHPADRQRLGKPNRDLPVRWERRRRRGGVRIAEGVAGLVVGPVRRIGPVAAFAAGPGVGRRVQRLAARHRRPRLGVCRLAGGLICGPELPVIRRLERRERMREGERLAVRHNERIAGLLEGAFVSAVANPQRDLRLIRHAEIGKTARERHRAAGDRTRRRVVNRLAGHRDLGRAGSRGLAVCRRLDADEVRLARLQVARRCSIALEERQLVRTCRRAHRTLESRPDRVERIRRLADMHLQRAARSAEGHEVARYDERVAAAAVQRQVAERRGAEVTPEDARRPERQVTVEVVESQHQIVIRPPRRGHVVSIARRPRANRADLGRRLPGGHVVAAVVWSVRDIEIACSVARRERQRHRVEPSGGYVLLGRHRRRAIRPQQRSVARIHHQLPRRAVVVRPAHVLRVEIVVRGVVAARAARAVGHPDLDFVPARHGRLEGARRDNSAAIGHVVQEHLLEARPRIRHHDAFVVVDLHPELVGLFGVHVHRAPVDPLSAVDRPVHVVAPDGRPTLRRLRIAAHIGGKRPELATVNAVTVGIMRPVRPFRQGRVVLVPVHVRAREERLIDAGEPRSLDELRRHDHETLAFNRFSPVVLGHDLRVVLAVRIEPPERKRRPFRRSDASRRLLRRQLVRQLAVQAFERHGRRPLADAPHHDVDFRRVDQGVADAGLAERERRIDRSRFRFAIGQERRILDCVVLGLHPIGARHAVHQPAFVILAAHIGLVAVRVAAKGEVVVDIACSRNCTRLNQLTVAVDRQRRARIDEGDVYPRLVEALAGEGARDARLIVAACRETRVTAAEHLNFPAVFLGVDPLAREKANVAGHAIKPNPARNRKRVAEAERTVARYAQIATRGARRRLTGTADRCVVARVADAVLRVALRRRGVGRAVLGRVRADAFRLAEVPHAAVVRVPGRERVMLGRRGIAPLHGEDRAVRERRQPHPDERLALRIPRVDLEVEQILVLIDKRKIRRALTAFSVVEPSDRLRRDPHQHGKVCKLPLARIPAHRQLGSVSRSRPHGQSRAQQGNQRNSIPFHHFPFRNLIHP